MMTEDVPALLARRLRQEHGLSGPVTQEQLLDICEARNCPVYRSVTLRRPGYYVVPETEDGGPAGAFIALRWDADARVLAHELYHHLVHDNAQHGVIYTFPLCEIGANPDDDRAANRFADLMCGNHF